jgi:hypothetical protein
MIAIVFSILVLMAILSICGNIVMRVRLSKGEPSRDKLVWWRRGSDEVSSTYEELFPRSHLPMLSQFAFWLVLAFALVILIASLRKSN